MAELIAGTHRPYAWLLKNRKPFATIKLSCREPRIHLTVSINIEQRRNPAGALQHWDNYPDLQNGYPMWEAEKPYNPQGHFSANIYHLALATPTIKYKDNENV